MVSRSPSVTRFFSPTYRMSFSSSLEIIIMSPPSASTRARGPSLASFTSRGDQPARPIVIHFHIAGGAVVGNPADRPALFHARQLDNAAELSQCLANGALTRLFVSC